MRFLVMLSALLVVPACVEGPTPKCAPEAVAASNGPPAPPPPAPALVAALAPYGFLLGRWEAPPSPAGGGRYSFEPEAQGHVLVRRNTSESPRGKHDDVMMMYVAPQGGVRALYADNEGHVIDYSVALTESQRAVFTSTETPGAPRFRLTYWPNADGTVGGRFEMAPPGAGEFKVYLEWSAKRPAAP